MFSSGALIDGAGRFLGHRHAVLGDGGGAELFVDNDVAAFGTESDLDRVGQAVDATPQEALWL